MALPEVRLVLSSLQVDIDHNDITLTGYGNECLIKKMKPVKWAAIRHHLAGNSPMPVVNDQPARITAPESYMYYDDLCTVLYLVGFGPQGL